jgi:predicted aconitase with swiveling domain
LSFWGGLDAETGEIIDRHHPLSGRNVAGRVLVLPHGRGSCSASGVLLEAIRNGTAPAAIITARVDPIIGLGAILGDELYGRPVPVVVLTPEDFASIEDGDLVSLERDGSVTVVPGARY